MASPRRILTIPDFSSISQGNKQGKPTEEEAGLAKSERIERDKQRLGGRGTQYTRQKNRRTHSTSSSTFSGSIRVTGIIAGVAGFGLVVQTRKYLRLNIDKN